jgi:phosphoribosyl 1,2-cyclic phosphodiesterase
MAVGRKEARDTIATFIQPPQVDGINQVFTSFPKRINFEVNALPSQKNRCAAVVFIESETETRIGLGGYTSAGAATGIKKVDYSIAIQLFHHSVENNAEDAMADFDNVIDNLKNRLRSDHQFGDKSGVLVWQAAEPVINTSYGEPMSGTGTAIETWAVVRFDVTQVINA